MDDLGRGEAVDGFGESIVVRVADAAHRRLDAGLRPGARCVFDGDVFADSIAVVHEPAFLRGPPIKESLFQSVQDEAGMRRPAQFASRRPGGHRAADDERDIDEAGPGRDVGEVRGDPCASTSSAKGRELAINVIEKGHGARLVARRGADRLAADDAFEAHGPHQGGQPCSGPHPALALQLPPHLADPVDPEVRLKHAPDLLL